MSFSLRSRHKTRKNVFIAFPFLSGPSSSGLLQPRGRLFRYSNFVCKRISSTLAWDGTLYSFLFGLRIPFRHFRFVRNVIVSYRGSVITKRTTIIGRSTRTYRQRLTYSSENVIVFWQYKWYTQPPNISRRSKIIYIRTRIGHTNLTHIYHETCRTTSL